MKPEKQRREIWEGIEMGMLELYMNYGTFQIVIAKLVKTIVQCFSQELGSLPGFAISM